MYRVAQVVQVCHLRRWGVADREAPDLNDLVSSTRAANLVGVSVETIKKWRQRGHLIVSGLDDHQRPRYRWIDVVRAEKKVRQSGRPRRAVA